MSTTHYSPSASAADTERYIRGKEDERGVAITCDVPGGPGAFSARARALTQRRDPLERPGDDQPGLAHERDLLGRLDGHPAGPPQAHGVSSCAAGAARRSRAA